VVLIVHSTPLTPSTTYSYCIEGGAQDLSGSTAGTRTQVTFTTGARADVQAPVVAMVSTPGSADVVAVTAQVSIRFDEPVNPLSVNASSVALTSSAGSVPYSANFGNSNRDLILVPKVPLQASSLHTLTIDGVADVAGNDVLVA